MLFIPSNWQCQMYQENWTSCIYIWFHHLVSIEGTLNKLRHLLEDSTLLYIRSKDFVKLEAMLSTPWNRTGVGHVKDLLQWKLLTFQDILMPGKMYSKRVFVRNLVWENSHEKFRWSDNDWWVSWFALYLRVGLVQSPVLVVQLKMDTGQQPIPPHLRLQEEAALYRRHVYSPSAPVAYTKHPMVSRWYQILAAICICMV